MRNFDGLHVLIAAVWLAVAIEAAPRRPQVRHGPAHGEPPPPPSVEEAPSYPPPVRCHRLLQCVHNMGSLLVAQCPSQYRKASRTVIVGHGKNVAVVNRPPNDPYASLLHRPNEAPDEASAPPVEEIVSVPNKRVEAVRAFHALAEATAAVVGAAIAAEVVAPPAAGAPSASSTSGSGSGNNTELSPLGMGAAAASTSHDSRNVSDFDEHPGAAGRDGPPDSHPSKQVDPRVQAFFALDPVRSADCLNASESRAAQEECGRPQWIDEAHWYDNISFIVLVGDSTILRSFKYVTNASDEEYVERVTDLPGLGILHDVTVVPAAARRIPVVFIRSLFVSTARYDFTNVFRVVEEEIRRRRAVAAQHEKGWNASRPLIVFTYGPHDTSWLVFQRPMPFFSKKGVGVWKAARDYWTKFMYASVNDLGLQLVQRFADADRRPVVVFREHFRPDCRHPKYARNNAAKCRELLAPQVVPFYRNTLAAALSVINVPMVSMDWLVENEYCSFMDAGHLRKSCKRWELQLTFQAFRAITQTPGIVQGHQSQATVAEVYALARNVSSVVEVVHSILAGPAAGTPLGNVCPRTHVSYAPVAVTDEDNISTAGAVIAVPLPPQRGHSAVHAQPLDPLGVVVPLVRIRRDENNAVVVDAKSAAGSFHRRIDMQRRDERSKTGVFGFVFLVAAGALWLATRKPTPYLGGSTRSHPSAS